MNIFSTFLSPGRSRALAMSTALGSATLASLALTGCASLQTKPVKAAAALPVVMTKPVPPETNASSDEPAPALNPNLPKLFLTKDLLYKILSAEIALQRGNWESAYVTLLSAAQQTRDPRLAHRAAEIALAATQNREAIVATRLWRELDPDSAEADQYYLALMLVNNNLPAVQRGYSERLSNASPEQRGAILLQAQRLLQGARDKPGALRVLENLISPYKNTAEAHLALALAAFQMQDKLRSLDEARMALELKPDSQLAVLSIAQASTTEAAANEFVKFLRRNPKARDVRLAYASVLIDFKQFNPASAQFEQLLNDKPDDLMTLYTLGVLAMQRKQPTEALTYFTRYLSAAGTDEEQDPSRVYMNLAQLASERNDYVAAYEWLAKIEAGEGKNPVWLTAQMRRATLMSKEGKLKAARAFLQQVHGADNAEQAQLIKAESQLLRDAKQSAEAFQLLQAAALKFPDNADLHYDFAMLAEQQQKLPEMETALRRAIKLAPDNPNAYNALGYSFADRNIRLEEATNLIEKALLLSKGDPFIMDSYGWVKFRLGQLDAAEKFLREAYVVRPDVEIAVHLGEVLWVQGKQAEARQLWQDAAGKDSDSDALKKTLQRLGVKL